MTREELVKQIEENQKILDEAKTNIRAANVELSKFQAQDSTEAQAQIDLICTQISEMYNQAKKLANEFQLEFTIEDEDYGEFSFEFPSYEYGNWNHSTC